MFAFVLFSPGSINVHLEVDFIKPSNITDLDLLNILQEETAANQNRIPGLPYEILEISTDGK